MVPEQKPAVTPGGKPTLRKRTKTDRNEVYTRALASTVLATAKEALAVAPGTDEARVLVIRNDVGAATPVDHLGAIYVGRFARAALRAVAWRTADPVALLLTADNAQLRRKGTAKEVVHLNIDGDPDLQQLLGCVRWDVGEAETHDCRRARLGAVVGPLAPRAPRNGNGATIGRRSGQAPLFWRRRGRPAVRSQTARTGSAIRVRSAGR
jgi:hypothetical protein